MEGAACDIVDVKVEIDPDDVAENQRMDRTEDDDYKPETEPESETGPSDSETSNDGKVLGDMEGKVINFLAESSRSKTKGKSSGKQAARFKCNKCSSIFRYQSTLDYHKKSQCGTKVIKGSKLLDKGSGKIWCDTCDKQFCSRTALMVHMRIHTGERPFSCSLCNRSFFQKAHLNDHVANMHSTGYALCRICNETFRDKLELSKHMKTHKEAQASIFACKECKENFSTKYLLNNHLAKEHNITVNNVVRCSICSEPFDTLALLMKHRAEKHPNQHRPIVPPAGGVECRECGNHYSGAKQLQAHMRRYHRASLPCPHCPRLFPSKYDLRIHARSHTGEKPYPCHFCGRCFSRKSVLDLHITLHTGTKDFLCCLCGAAFNRKSKLIIHFATHTNSTVQCKICKKEFRCESYLKSHMKTHLGPSECSLCGLPFKSRRSLLVHMKRNHRDWFYNEEDPNAAVSLDDTSSNQSSSDMKLTESEMAAAAVNDDECMNLSNDAEGDHIIKQEPLDDENQAETVYDEPPLPLPPEEPVMPLPKIKTEPLDFDQANDEPLDCRIHSFRDS